MSARVRDGVNVCTQMRDAVAEWRPYLAALAERLEAIAAAVNPLIERVDAHDARLAELDDLRGRVAVLEADRAARARDADRERKRGLAQQELASLVTFPAFLKSLVFSSPLSVVKRHVYTQILADPDRSPRDIATAYLRQGFQDELHASPDQAEELIAHPKMVALLESFPVAL